MENYTPIKFFNSDPKLYEIQKIKFFSLPFPDATISLAPEVEPILFAILTYHEKSERPFGIFLVKDILTINEEKWKPQKFFAMAGESTWLFWFLKICMSGAGAIP